MLQKSSAKRREEMHNGSNVESGEEENGEKNYAKEVKTKRKQSNFYATTSEVKRALILKRINIGGRTEQHVKQLHKGFHRLVFEPGDWGWSQMRKERFHAQRRSKLMHQGGVDLRTNPSQEGGNDVDKRARRTQAVVDVFPNKESWQDYVFKFQEVQDSNQNSRTS